MKPSCGKFLVFSAVLIPSLGFAIDLKQSKFNQVVNDVKILEMPSKTVKPAVVNDIFKVPDILRTGPASRVELIAEDRTITRVGANSIFSFDEASRTISLEKGSVLFQVPKAKGGGTIRTTSAAASVLGTTILATATEDGGFKLLVLEGKGKVTLPNGKSKVLKAGQMIFILPNGGGFSPVINFKLEEQVQGSQLVNGFRNPLPSLDLINLEITRQNKLLANGQAVDTGLLVGDAATVETVQVVDPNLLQQALDILRHENDGPIEPPPDNGGPVDPPPINFDVVVNDAIVDDANLIHVEPNVAHILQGQNIQVNGEVIDLSVAAHAPTFHINASGTLELTDNPTHSMRFGTPPVLLPPVNTEVVVVEGVIDFLHLSAADFLFPENFRVIFDGQALSIAGVNDLTLSSAGTVGLTFENNATEGAVLLQSSQNLNVSGNVRFNADLVELSSGNHLTMNGGTFGSSSTVLQAVNDLSVKGASFESASSFISMSARTITLENITFPGTSTVSLQSDTGLLAANPNTGAAVQPGYVNFVRNVNYGNVPAQNAINEGIFIFSRGNNQ